MTSSVAGSKACGVTEAALLVDRRRVKGSRSSGRSEAIVKLEERPRDAVGILDLRIVADTVEQDDVGLRHELAVARHHVSARDGVLRAVDDAERDRRRLECADPPSAVEASLLHVAKQLGHDPGAVVLGDETPEVVELGDARLRAWPEDRGEAAGERTFGRQ